MFDLLTPEVATAQILFLILLPCVLFAPGRWAVLAWLIMGNLDVPGSIETRSASIGWINAVKGILLPLYLWWRFRQGPSETLSSLPAKLWMSLTLYAAIASLWSPFPLAAVKLVGNMVGILLTVLVMEKAARKGFVDQLTIVLLILISLGLGAVQTFYYGGVVYGYDGAGQPTRFSSFVWAQQYAAFLVAFFTALLWSRGFRPAVRMSLLFVVGAALLFNGSRTWFLGAAIVVLVYLIFSLRRILGFVALGVSASLLAVLCSVSFSPMGSSSVSDTSSRIVATISALIMGEDTSSNTGLGNVSFRLAIYKQVSDELRAGDVRDIFLGHGTSSGGNVVLRVFPLSNRVDLLDANRAIHNEWLRALYEWGIAGMLLLTGVFVTLLGGTMIRYRQGGRNPSLLGVMSFLLAFLLALSAENIIAGAGNAVTMSLGLATALLWMPQIRSSAERLRLRNAERRTALCTAS